MRALPPLLLSLLLVAAVPRLALAGDAPTPAPDDGLQTPLKPKMMAGFTLEELERFSARFTKELWPLLTRNSTSCVDCHDGESDSQLHILDEPDAAFKRLLTEGRLDPNNKLSLHTFVKLSDKKKRMPKPPSKPWTEKEIALLHKFGTDLHKLQRKDGSNMDEAFPMELLVAFVGERPQGGPDTTFITYYQLKRKVKQIFNDDWVRNGVDLFNENIALFGGADFVRSFNESATASATFLSGIDQMGVDVASRAYVGSTGPFAGGMPKLPSPLSKKSADGAYKKEINRLYNRILFRDATEPEINDAFKLIQNVYRDEAQLAGQQRELRFELRVDDGAELSARRDFAITLSSGACGLYQEFIDQNAAGADKLARLKLGREFTFKAGDTQQQFQIVNAGTNGNVSIAGIELTGPLPARDVIKIAATDPAVQIFGAWVTKDGNDFVSYEDRNEDKGNGAVAFPIKVPADGKYELAVTWRRGEGGDKSGKPGGNAGSVLVEVLSHDATQHALEPLPPVPPKGQAHFWVDQTISNIPYWDLKAAFQFGPEDGVEINNSNTSRPVVADAVHFAQNKTAAKFMVRGTEAAGNDKWVEYNLGRFKPYNTFGPKLLSDNNAKKGELKLLYKPSVKKNEWKENEFYGVQLSIPGKAGNETQAPVIVHAQQSSPLIQVRFPPHVRAGGNVTLDASASYNLQRSKLNFTWTQVSGPRVDLKDPKAPKIEFAAPTLTAQQAAWEGLCRALLRHPDFLFTRPPSIAALKDQKARQRLQLVKIAQDLVGRTPTDDEFKRLEKTPLSAFVDEYLASQEFKDFYFHRIRLVLESHGSETDDEPTRLWCHIAFNNRSFKEILTADYSVNKKLERVPRPEYHGKTGLLTMKGFIDGKPGLPHFNYAAVVCEKFLGYIFEVPADIVAQREGATAASTTHPDSACYSCHKILTPLAYQRMRWTDDGKYKDKDEKGKPIDDTDRKLVESYPFKGNGMEAFALQAQHKERFIRTMIQTHFVFYFGREMRCDDEERVLYKNLWDTVHASNFSIKSIIRTMLNSTEYLEARPSGMPNAKKGAD